MRLRIGQVGTLLLLAASLHADTLFSSFGPGGTFTTTFGWGIGGPFEMAYPFVSSETAAFETAALGISTPQDPRFTQRSVNIDLLTDASDSPGTILESFQLVNVLPFSGSIAPPIIVDSVSHPLLEANTRYWLAIENPGNTGSIDWGTAGVGPNQRASRPVGATSWFVGSADHFTSGAFDVTGTPLSSVPEPSTAFLAGGVFAIGLVSFGARQKFPTFTLQK